MKLKPLEIAGILALGYFLWSKFVTDIQNNLFFSKFKAKLGKLTPQGVEINLLLTVSNRNDIDLPLDWFKGQLIYGQYIISDLNISTPVIIGAKQTVEIPMKAFVAFAGTVINVMEMITSGKWWLAFTVKGKASSKGIVFSVEQPLQII